HDRYLLDRVSTIILALDGTGKAQFFADSAQWEENRKTESAPPRAAAPKPKPEPTKPAAKKLTYKEQKEWEGMETKILEAESALEGAKAAVEDPSVATDPIALQDRCAALDVARAEVERLYARWAELEGKLADIALAETMAGRPPRGDAPG